MLPCQRAVPTTPADRNGCICPVSFPVSCCLPGYTGRSASASLLSRPAQASLTLRPTGSLSRPRRPLSQGSSPFGYPNKLPVSYSINRLLSRWNLPPLATRAQRGTLGKIAAPNVPLACRRISDFAHAVYFSHLTQGCRTAKRARQIAHHIEIGGRRVCPPYKIFSMLLLCAERTMASNTDIPCRTSAIGTG